MSEYTRKNTSIIPEFFITKLAVTEAAIDISCVLRIPPGATYTDLAKGSKYSQYVSFYFVAGPKVNTGALSSFYYPDNRIRNIIASANLKSNIDIASWEMVLGPNKEKENSELNPYNFKGYTKLSIADVLQGIEFDQNPMDKSNLEKKSNTSPRDIPFRTTIQLVNGALSNELGDLVVMAFSQLDLRKMKEDFKLKSFSGIENIGGPLLYEKCLERKPATDGVTGDFIPPQNKRAFFREDGTIYSGKTHYHSSFNPGPDGYVGWMAGAPGGDMADRPRLTPRAIPNDKVTSNVYMERALNPTGMSLTEQGAGASAVNTPELEKSDPGFALFGDSIVQVLNSQTGHGISTALTAAERKREKQNKLKQLVTTSLKRGKLNITNTNVNPTDLSWIETEGSTGAHASMLMLKLGDILSGNSRFGYLLDMHVNLASQSPESKEAVRAMSSNSKIGSLEVFRRRVTNFPVGNNSVSTAVYEVYDKDEVEEFVIKSQSDVDTTTDAIIASSKNSMAEMFEHNPDHGSLQKTIIIKDYDLFERHDTGNYEYVIELLMEDGIYAFLKEKTEQLSKAIRSFSEYVREAEQPYLSPEQSNYYNKNQFADTEADQKERLAMGHVGNYDYVNNTFTEKFVRRSLSLRKRTDDIVDAYIDMYYILTGRSQFTESRKLEMKNALLATSTSLEILGRFLDLCLELENRAQALISFSAVGVRDTMNLGSNKRRVSGEYKLPNNMIKLRGSANIIIKAVHKNSLFVELAGTTRSDMMALARSGASKTRTLDLKPVRAASFFALTSKPASAQDNTSLDPSQLLRKNFEKQLVVGVDGSRGDKDLARASSKVEAAIEKAKTGPIVGEKERTIGDELTELNNILSQYGNSSFEGLVTKASFTNTSQIDNKEKEKEKFISKNIQSSILESIITTDKASRFVDEVEKEYKDLYFKKEALAETYDVVKSTMAAHKMMKNKKKKLSYKDKVKDGKNVKQEKQKRKDEAKDLTTSLKKANYSPHTISKEEGLIPTTNGGDLGIVIYKKIGNSLDGAIPVNNVKLITKQTSSRNVTSQRASSVRGGGATSTTTTSQTISSTTGGGSGGY